MRHALALLFLGCVLCGQQLPLGKLPAGKVVLILQPHHDDHTTDYGMGGLIARFVDEGYEAYYVRASNDEKDGPHGQGRNDMVNLRESMEATRILGVKKVISLNWRNDYTGPIPLNELREQLILLIRKYRPDVVLGHDPWEHYQKNPDHRNVARAMAEAYWLAGYANVHPEHLKLGLKPHQAWRLYGKARLDWGLGHRPNIAIELNESQVRRKQKAYQTHRNVYAHPGTARAVIVALAKENLYVPEFEGLSDQDAAVMMEEWHMDWISRLRGSQAGVKYAEDYYLLDEFDYLPGLKEYLKHPEKPPPEPKPSESTPPRLIQPKQVALVVTADASDYLLAAGGTIASLADQGATVYVIRVTNDEKDSWDLPPEETARRTRAESQEAARILGVKDVISLGYRAAELAGVSFTDIRDRLIFYIRHYQPQVLFIPNPYTEYDRVLDRYYTGRAAEDAWRSAAFENFGPALADVGLKPHLTPELYYFAQPFDPRRHEPESTATFVPQPKVIDISGTFQRKVRAVQALKTINYSTAQRLKQRFDATGRRLATLDDPARLAELNVRGLGASEEFRYAEAEYRIPSKYRR